MNSADTTLYKKLLSAYQMCLKNKPQIKKTSFHLYHETNLFRLASKINDRRYSPKKSSVFIVLHPKPREIIAAHIQDRVVHHLIYNYMNPYWERRFVNNSYACRIGKGPIAAGNDLKHFLAKQRRGCADKTLYYLKVDVRSFFPSINLPILYSILERKGLNSFYLDLCKTIIFHRPTKPGNHILKSPREFWKLIPEYKSMFSLPDHKGLPIGNLTSQFFANVYMNELDQFITHTLGKKVLFWQRYVDDVLLFSYNKSDLKEWVVKIESFLNQRLDLQLNPKKTVIQPLHCGVDHLGLYHKLDYQLVRKTVVFAAKNKVLEKNGDDNIFSQNFLARLNSYLGHFSNANSYRLRKNLLSKVAKLVDKKNRYRLSVPKDCSKLVLKPDIDLLSLREKKERQLIQEFREEFIGDPSNCEHYVKNWKQIDEILEWSEGL